MSDIRWTKGSKFELVAMTILKAYTVNPRKKLNVRMIARETRVSPAWIYKYMGTTRDEIMRTAIDTLAPMITEVDQPLLLKANRAEWLKSYLRGLNKTLLEVETYPELYRFYFMTCMRDGSQFRTQLQHHEHLYLTMRVAPKIQLAFGYSRSDSKAFATLLHKITMGLAFDWLTERNRTPAKRRQLIRQVRALVFEPTL